MTERMQQPHNSQTTATKKADGFYFEGFRSPTTTAVPDEFFDLLAPHLSEAELRVLLYIMRRTFGFKKHADAISLSQLTEGIRCRDGRILDEGTGLSKPAVLKGVAGLVSKGIIEVEKATGYDGRNQTNIYKLRFAETNNFITNQNTKAEQLTQPYSMIEYTNHNYQSLDKPVISPDPRYVANVPEAAPHTHQPVEDAEQNRFRHALNGANSKKDLPLGNRGEKNSKAKQPTVNNIDPSSNFNLPSNAASSNEPVNGKDNLPMPMVRETASERDLPKPVNLNYSASKATETEGVKPFNLQHKQNQKSVKTALQTKTTMLLGNVALASQNDAQPNDNQHILLAQLVAFGLQPKIADQLITRYDFDYISQKITLLEAQGLKGIKNPAGFLCWALENDYQPVSKIPFAQAQKYTGTTTVTIQNQLPAQPKVVSAARRNRSAAKRPAAPLPVNPAYRSSPTASDATSFSTGVNSSRRTAINAGARAVGQGAMSQTTPPIFDYTPIMEEVCRIIAGRLGRSDLANLLQNMQLLEIKAEGENLEVILQPAEAWQKRLITSNAISLIELALSQQLDQPCQVYFI